MVKKIKPTIAVSGCLLGEEIRYNGQHKRHPHVVHELNKEFNFHSFCPEVSMGLGVPRPAIHLMQKTSGISLVNAKNSKVDHTNLALQTFKKMVGEYKDVCGFIFTQNSPSCGYDPIKVYSEEPKKFAGKARGVFAEFICEHYPLAPKIDSGRLYDNNYREIFVSQVKVFSQFQNMEKSLKNLIHFHECHKLYYLLYGSTHFKKLEELSVGVCKEDFKEKLKLYENYLFSCVFNSEVTKEDRINVVEHIGEYFQKLLDVSDQKYLRENIKAFHKGKLSFQSLMILINFLILSYKESYLCQQNLFKLFK